jgi:prepilin-type N-terminal cleavage/methylation domain-containing protein
MKFNKFVKNQHGVSLVEILAAVTILSIVFVSFLSFFPQASKHSNKTGEMLSAVNLAKEKLVIVKSNQNIKDLLIGSSNDLSRSNYSNLKLTNDIQVADNQFELNSEDDVYKTTILIDTHKVSYGNLIVTDNLYKTYIVITNKKGEKVSDLFGYITVKGDN